MKELEKYVSPLVEQMFPSFYQEEGKGFITFVKAYYEWLETSNSAIYQARRLPDFRDIDTTLDDFIVQFKEKYLKNIQFDTASNKKLFVKNALDFYRSKGSERSVDLFFRLIYGTSAEVYYPGDDLFRLSDGEWFEPIYLEVTRTDKNPDFIGKTVTGTISGATAFVDRLIRRNKSGKYIDVFYISNVEGNFQTGEIVKFDADLDGNPKIIGSMNFANVTSGGGGFTVGESIQFYSNNGGQGKAIVNSIANVTGVVDFSISDGGFGYNSSSQVLVSNVNLTLANVVETDTSRLNLFDQFETVTQKLANISFNAANADFTSGTNVYSYHANNSLAGTGEIVFLNQTAGDTNGYMTIAISGNFRTSGNVYTQSNAIVANTVLYTDVSATGNLINYAANVTIYNIDTVGSYELGEVVFQSNASVGEWANGVVSSISVEVANTILALSNVSGVFNLNTAVTGRSSNATANLVSFSNKIGLSQISSNVFYTCTINAVTTSSSGVHAALSRKSAGNNATFAVGNLLYSETVSLNTDYINSRRHSYLRFNTATTDFTVGDNIFRYYANGQIAARAIIVNLQQTSGNPNGYATIYTRIGNTATFSPGGTNLTNTFYTTSNAQSGVSVSDLSINYLQFTSANADFANNAYIQRYYANGVLAANAKVILVSQISGQTNGYLLTAIESGNTSTFKPLTSALITNTFYTTSNVINAVTVTEELNAAYYTRIPLNSLSFGFPRAPTANIANNASTSKTFNANSAVNQTDEFITIATNDFTNGQVLTYTVSPGTTAIGGLADGAPYYVVNANSTGVSLSTTYGGSKINITKGLTETQTLTVSQVLDNIFEYTSTTAGRIRTITGINQGNSYSDSPFVIVYDPTIAGYGKYDYSVRYTGASGTFLVGEIITGQTSEATARVKSVNTTVLQCTRLNVFKDLTSETITGATSGVTATVSSVGSLSTYAGFNAIILGDAISTNGSVTSLRVIDSGIGYVDKEEVTFYAVDDTNKTGLAELSVTKQGTAEGRYKQTGGFLSSDKYIHDGEYYQEFSYEVQASLPFEKYSEIFKKVVHVAGTRLFGKFTSVEVTNSNIQAACSTITIA